MATTNNVLNQNTLSNQPSINNIPWDFNVTSFVVASNGALTLTAGLTAPTDLILASFSKDVNITSAVNVNITPTSRLSARLDSKTAVGAPPAISPPAGFSFVIRADATGDLYYLVP